MMATSRPPCILILGNTYYKLDDIPSALLYFEKAHKLNPADEDINFNIRLARSKTTDKLDEVPEFFATAWWHSFILFLSAIHLLYRVCCFFWQDLGYSSSMFLPILPE